MGKRGNENSQMRREDYEQMEAGGGEGDSTPTGTFERADPEEMRRRKIFSAKRPTAQSSSSSNNASGGNPGGGLFGSVNFVGGLKGFGSTREAAPAPRPAFSLVGKPISSASAPSALVASQPQPWFGQPKPSNSRNKPAPGSKLEDPVISSEVAKLADGLTKFMENIANAPRAIPTKALDRFLMTLNARINSRDREARPDGEISGEGSSSAAAATSTIDSASTLQSSSTAFSFGSGPVASKAPASAPFASSSGPLFGNNTSTSSNLFGGTPSSTPDFSFGGNGGSAKPGASSSATSNEPKPAFQFQPSPPAPAPASVPFSFSKSTPVAQITNMATAADPSNDHSTDDTNENNGNDGGDAVEEAVDPNWDTIHKVEKAKLRRLDDGQFVDIGTGKLKLERHKSNGTARLVLRNLGSGGILANMAVTSAPVALKKSEPGAKKQKGHITIFTKMDPKGKAQMYYLVTKFDLLDETFTQLKELSGAD